MTGDAPDLLLDEHVNRVFQRVLKERGYEVEHATDRFGEQTVDRELLAWCGSNDVYYCTNDAKDFEMLHETVEHAGLLCYRDQTLPNEDPEGLASALDAAVEQYGADLTNEFVELDAWYDWLHD